MISSRPVRRGSAFVRYPNGSMRPSERMVSQSQQQLTSLKLCEKSMERISHLERVRLQAFSSNSEKPRHSQQPLVHRPFQQEASRLGCLPSCLACVIPYVIYIISSYLHSYISQSTSCYDSIPLPGKKRRAPTVAGRKKSKKAKAPVMSVA